MNKKSEFSVTKSKDPKKLKNLPTLISMEEGFELVSTYIDTILNHAKFTKVNFVQINSDEFSHAINALKRPNVTIPNVMTLVIQYVESRETIAKLGEWCVIAYDLPIYMIVRMPEPSVDVLRVNLSKTPTGYHMECTKQ